MTPAEAVQYLLELNRGGAKLGVERMQAFATLLGHPECAYPVIHVAGTNGKGSTCALLERVYREAGYKTGMFTSPHLISIGERLRVNGDPVGLDRLAQLVDAHSAAVGHFDSVQFGELTYFEFMTGVAFSYFKEEAVDLSIIEVGLGGRLDSTNIVTPSISVITSIGLDHCEQLGDTIELIAREKAGIIKQGVPLVIGELPEAAEVVIREIAGERDAPVYSIGERFKGKAYPGVGFRVPYQRRNAAVAQLVAEVLDSFFPVTKQECARGFASVSLPGRWQEISLPGERTLILESAHNEEGARMLAESLEQLKQEHEGSRLTVLLGSLGVDRAESLLQVVARYAQALILVEPNQPRSVPVDVLRALVPAGFCGEVLEGEVGSLFSGSRKCLGGDAGEVFLVVGSICLVGEVLAVLGGGVALGGVELQDRMVPVVS